MIRNPSPICFLWLLACLFSCQNQPAETRAERIAKGVCDCAAPLLSLNKQAANAATGGEINFEAIQDAFEKTRACVVLQRMKPEDIPDIQKALALKCPELAAEAELLEELLGK